MTAYQSLPPLSLTTNGLKANRALPIKKINTLSAKASPDASGQPSFVTPCSERIAA